jgi:hypothetical protein
MKKLALIAAACLFAPGLAAAADLTGAWKISANVADMPITILCNLTQSGAALSGTCGLQDGPGAPTAFTGGTVDGDAAKWAYDDKFQDMPLHVAYTAVVKDAAMTGTVTVFDMPNPFTAVRQQVAAAPTGAVASSSR